MSKNKRKKSPKSRRSRYYVDNPNMLELQLLDEIQKTDVKPVTISSAAAAELPLEQISTSKETDIIAVFVKSAPPTLEETRTDYSKTVEDLNSKEQQEADRVFLIVQPEEKSLVGEAEDHADGELFMSRLPENNL